MRFLYYFSVHMKKQTFHFRRFRPLQHLHKIGEEAKSNHCAISTIVLRCWLYPRMLPKKSFSLESCLKNILAKSITSLNARKPKPSLFLELRGLAVASRKPLHSLGSRGKQIVLLAPHKTKSSKVGDVVTPLGSWTSSRPLSHGCTVASRTCLDNISKS